MDGRVSKPCGPGATFKPMMTHAMSALHKNAEELMCLMEVSDQEGAAVASGFPSRNTHRPLHRIKPLTQVFIREPLVDWVMNARQKSHLKDVFLKGAGASSGGRPSFDSASSFGSTGPWCMLFMLLLECHHSPQNPCTLS